MRVNDDSQLVLAQLSLPIVCVCARACVCVPFCVCARALLRSKFNYTGQNVEGKFW